MGEADIISLRLSPACVIPYYMRMKLDPIALLADLIALPSVNPMGRDVSGPEFFECQVTDYLQALFTRLGWRWERTIIEPQRDNIVARIDGAIPPEQGGPLLLFEVHQDTVPVDGMTIAPWTPEIRDGRIYGRGSCDIKGGMAAMLSAFSRLATEPVSNRPTVVLACAVNEEFGHSGAKGIADSWSDNSSRVRRSTLLPRPPDAAIVAEPTLLDVVVAHKGTVRWKLHTHGRAAHSSQPQQGENAVFRMRSILELLENYQREVVGTLGEHPLCGRPTLSVGTIRGGLSANTVPDRCTIEIDRRTLPGESPDVAYQHVLEYLRAHLPHDFPFTSEGSTFSSSGLSDHNNEALAARLCQTSASVAGASRPIGVPYGTDATIFSAAGVPTVVFGPGSIDQAHTADEWLLLEQLHLASEIYYRFAMEFGK